MTSNSMPPTNSRPVQQTSIATRGKHPDEVTIQFLKWTAYRDTGYQKGQYAGFLKKEAAKFIENKRAVLVEGTL